MRRWPWLLVPPSHHLRSLDAAPCRHCLIATARTTCVQPRQISEIGAPCHHWCGESQPVHFERRPLMNGQLNANASKDLIFRIFSRSPRERELLSSKHLLIVGVGSVGSAIALMAARAGIGKFTLIDPGVLTPENVRGHFCDLSQIGRSKAYAISELIRRIN